MNQVKLKIGAKVRWQNREYDPDHEGVVAAIVPAGARPRNVAKDNGLDSYLRDVTSGQFGLPRDHESYLVLEGKTKTSKGKLLWPRVSVLCKA